MTAYVFETLAEAELFAQLVDQALGYPRPGVPEAPFPQGWTLRHAAVLARPDGLAWAYPADGVPADVSIGFTAVALGPEWTPEGRP